MYHPIYLALALAARQSPILSTAKMSTDTTIAAIASGLIVTSQANGILGRSLRQHSQQLVSAHVPNGIVHISIDADVCVPMTPVITCHTLAIVARIANK